MSSMAHSAPWSREALTRRVVWQPLGVVLSLWAWFGWLTPWFAALLPLRGETTAPNPATFIMGAALLGHGSAVIVNRMSLSRLAAAIGRLLLLSAVLGAALWVYLGGLAGGTLRWQASWVVVVGVGYAWWRAGRLTAAEALEPDATLRRLFTGALLSAAAIVLFPDASSAGGVAFVPIYVGGGLAGVVLGQVNDASRRRGGRPLPFGLSWHAGLLCGVALVAVLGVALGAALTSDAAWGVVGAGARLLAGAARVLGSILMPIVEAIFRLLGPIFDGIIRWLQSMMGSAEDVQITIPQPIGPVGGEGAEPGGGSQLLGQVGIVLRFLAAALGAAVLLWMAIRTTLRARAPNEEREIEIVEPVAGLAPSGRPRGLRDLLRSAMRLPQRARGLYHALLVRRVYAQLLGWAAGEGHPRGVAETPLELGAALARLRPILRQDLETITQAYLHVRYGEMPEDDQMVRGVLTSWDRVRGSAAPSRLPKEGNSL